eukprot:gene1497-biopygen1783
MYPRTCSSAMYPRTCSSAMYPRTCSSAMYPRTCSSAMYPRTYAALHMYRPSPALASPHTPAPAGHRTAGDPRALFSGNWTRYIQLDEVRMGICDVPRGNRALARVWREHGTGYTPIRGTPPPRCRHFLAWGGAGVARAWRGHVRFPQADASQTRHARVPGASHTKGIEDADASWACPQLFLPVTKQMEHVKRWSRTHDEHAEAMTLF